MDVPSIWMKGPCPQGKVTGALVSNGGATVALSAGMAIRERPTGRGDWTPESGSPVTSCTAVENLNLQGVGGERREVDHPALLGHREDPARPRGAGDGDAGGSRRLAGQGERNRTDGAGFAPAQVQRRGRVPGVGEPGSGRIAHEVLGPKAGKIPQPRTGGHLEARGGRRGQVLEELFEGRARRRDRVAADRCPHGLGNGELAGHCGVVGLGIAEREVGVGDRTVKDDHRRVARGTAEGTRLVIGHFHQGLERHARNGDVGNPGPQVDAAVREGWEGA